MTALAHTSRSLAILFTLLTIFWPGLLIAQLFAREYDGLPMLLVCGLFTGLFGVGAVVLYWCFRFSRSADRTRTARGLVWVLVVSIGGIGVAMAARLVWVLVLLLCHVNTPS
jgi:hypothetical protein